MQKSEKKPNIPRCYLLKVNISPKKYPQLDLFMELFNKVFGGKDHNVERELVHALNEQRNNFIHFNTDCFSLEKQYALGACAEALKAIMFIANADRRLFDCEEEQQEFEALSEKAQGQINAHQPPNK